MAYRSLVVAALLSIGCGGDDSGGEGEGTSSGSSADGSGSEVSSSGTGTLDCPSSELTVTLDGQTSADAMPQVEATGGEFAPDFDIVVGTDSAADKPWHTVAIALRSFGGDAQVDLQPESVTYTIARDNEAAMSASTMPSGVNVFFGTVDGTLTVDEPGLAVGEERCGSFDFTITWDDIDNVTHEAAATGTFAAIVQEAPAPGD